MENKVPLLSDNHEPLLCNSAIGISFDPRDDKSISALIEQWGDDGGECFFEGMNDKGEKTFMKVFTDKIVIKTMQEDGRVRVNIFNKDLTREKLYEGNWK